MDKQESNETIVKKIHHAHLWLLVFAIACTVAILLGDRPPDQNFFEYAAWMIIGVAGMVGIVFVFLLGLGWAAG